MAKRKMNPDDIGAVKMPEPKRMKGGDGNAKRIQENYRNNPVKEYKDANELRPKVPKD